MYVKLWKIFLKETIVFFLFFFFNEMSFLVSFIFWLLFCRRNSTINQLGGCQELLLLPISRNSWQKQLGTLLCLRSYLASKMRRLILRQGFLSRWELGFYWVFSIVLFYAFSSLFLPILCMGFMFVSSALQHGCSRAVIGTPYFFVNGIPLYDSGSDYDYKKWRSTIDPLLGLNKKAAQRDWTFPFVFRELPFEVRKVDM